jgi:hypothetical protein
LVARNIGEDVDGQEIGQAGLVIFENHPETCRKSLTALV